MWRRESQPHKTVIPWMRRPFWEAGLTCPEPLGSYWRLPREERRWCHSTWEEGVDRQPRHHSTLHIRSDVSFCVQSIMLIYAWAGRGPSGCQTPAEDD